MAFQIDTAEDEQLFRAYTTHRDAVRTVMGRGVYPNLVKALATYDEFDAALAGELADTDLLAYHNGLMAPIAPYIAQLRAGAAGFVQIMQGVETARPVTFGIALPEER